jgi:hypothetical protein
MKQMKAKNWLPILLGIAFVFVMTQEIFSQTPSKQKTMPNVVGMTCQQAQDAVKKAGLMLVGVGTTPTSDQRLDQKVFAQQPDPRKPTSTASLNCYRFVQVLLPNVVGMSIEQADAELRKIGITKYSIQSTVTTQNLRENKRVRAQTPAPGKPIGPVVLDCYQYKELKDLQGFPQSEQVPGFGLKEGLVVPPGGDPNLTGTEGLAAPNLRPQKK